MPRKPKVGLDYFPLDVDFESDPKMRKLSMSFESEAILISYIKIKNKWESRSNKDKKFFR